MLLQHLRIFQYIWAFSRGGGFPLSFHPLIFGGWIFRELWGDEGTPPYFEGAQFISEGFSWFDDMFEKIWISLKFWPFSAAGASLVTGAKIAISVSPAPLFLGFWWVSPPPPPILGGGESIFEYI